MLKNQPVLGLSTADVVNANDVRGLNVRNILSNDNDCIYMIHISENIDLCSILVYRIGM